MEAPSSEFSRAVAYAMKSVGTPGLELKQEQQAAIQTVYGGGDVFVWLPTGFGKSLCFEVLPFVYDYKLGRAGTPTCSLVLVLSPLVSLMVNQVTSLRKRGVNSAIISASDKIDKSLLATAHNLTKYSILFSVPEAILGHKWRESVEKPEISERIVAVVVDEAHCVSKWSKDFRSAYGKIHEIRALVPQGTPFMACTATVTKSVREEVITLLDMKGCEVISTSPDRPNIYYGVEPCTDITSDMSSLLRSLKEYKNKAPRVLVYCPSLSLCSDLYALFHFELGSESYHPPGAEQISDNRLFGMYHSNTPQYNKDVILKSMSEDGGVVRIVFATVALGMGVNLRGVNSVVHYGAPRSIDDYFQESGRGGRSGDNAQSIVYWRRADCPLRKEPKTVREHEVNAVRRYLENDTICRRQWLLDYFDPICAKPGLVSSLCCDLCAKRNECET